MVAWDAKGECASLYMKDSLINASSTARSTARSTRSQYSTISTRSAVEVYQDEIEPEVARRQWIAVGGIALLLVFIWLWAMNGGPLAALWAKD